VLLAPKWVTASNMNATVIADKFVPASQLCAGKYAKTMRRRWHLGLILWSDSRPGHQQ